MARRNDFAGHSRVQRLRRRRLPLEVLGLVAGLGLALAAAGSAKTLLFKLDPTDPTTLVSACALLAGIGLVAGLIPALRASRLDPSSALRTD